MSSQSPQRTRKSQQHSGVSGKPILQIFSGGTESEQPRSCVTGPAQTNVRREASPSPSLRERQRYVRTQSMPIPAAVHEFVDKETVQVQTQTQGQLPLLGYPRPIARVAPPQFLSHNEKWQMTDDLQADIDRADLLQQHQPGPQPAPGTEGVAYAGSAGSVQYGRMKTMATVSVGTEAVEGPTARRRASAGNSQEVQTQHRASPISYALRKTANTSPAFHQSMPSPRSLKNRTPDRSLPVQEEPDEHEHEPAPRSGVSPAPSSDLNPTKDLDHDAEETLVDLGDDDDDQQEPGGESTEGSGSHTPRSPSAVLFEQEQASRGIHEVMQPDKSAKPQQSNKSFNPADFQQTLKKLQSGTQDNSANGVAAYPQPVLNGAQGYNQPSNGVPAYPLSSNGVPAYPPPSSGTPGYPPPPPPFSRNESRGSYPNWIPDFYHNYPDEGDFLDEVSYMQHFMPGPTISTQNMHMRPGAPIPPTPHSQTSAPTPFQQNGMNGQGADSVPRTLAPPYSPAPGTPYPYPFSHMRRGFVYPAPGARITSSVYDPSVVQEQLRMQMQMYAYNNGALTDSTLSPASTPYPGMGPSYTPFSAFLNQSRAFALARAAGEGRGGGTGEDGRVTSASIRSSPSHMPVPLPALNGNGRGRVLKKRDRFSTLRGSGTARQRVKPPPRVDSTQPRETSPEPSSGEETAGEKYDVNQSVTGESQEWTNGSGHADDENGDWVDEDSEDEHDLLDLEFHPTYVTNPERRRKKWEQRWDELVRAFQALDRETDATLVLVASPSHTNTLHSLSSRSIRRDASLFDGHFMNEMKTSFGQIAAQRRAARTQRVSLLERLYASSTQPGDGSPGGSGEREEDLRKMLKTALHSLGALREMYEVREARWRDEERRMREEREGMDFLLQQTFGAEIAGNLGGP
ncbi:hypothetical protein M0805_006430 [Coniferiporia weirii]|nr:hypothetical protein M0805_006430 [Coniferiporia weirii]